MGNFPLEPNGQKIILAAWFLLWEKEAHVPGPLELGDVLIGLMRQSICWQAEHSALSLLPARPHSSSTPFPQDVEAILILPWSEASVSLIFQSFLPEGPTPTTAHRPLNNLSCLTCGWGGGGVLMFLLKSAAMLKLSSKTCLMFLDLSSSSFGLPCASHFTTGVHGGNKSWQQCWLRSFASGELGHAA